MCFPTHTNTTQSRNTRNTQICGYFLVREHMQDALASRARNGPREAGPAADRMRCPSRSTH